MRYLGVIWGITAALAVSPVYAAEDPVVTKINSVIKEIESLPRPNTNEEIAHRISLLGAKLTQAEPDPRRLMAGLTEYMTTTESAPQLVMMLWPSIATSRERAQFLAGEIGQTKQSQIGFVTALVERELVDQQSLVKYPEAMDAIGLDGEVLYSGTAFVPIMQASGGINPRLAAIWFSKAPYQAALACLGGHDDETRLRLQRVNDLRFEIEEGKSDDQKGKAWRNLDHELVIMLSSGSPAIELYAAGVLKWKRTIYPSLSESDSLASALSNYRSPLIDCILQGVTNVTLINLPSDKPILLPIASPFAQATPIPPTAITSQTKPIPPLATPSQDRTPALSPAVAENKSSPWPWAVGLLLLAVVGGILLKLRRK
jgi:hypothetical protein